MNIFCRFTGLVAYSDHATVSYYNQYGDVLYTSDCHSNSTSSVIVDTNSESDSGSSLLGGGAIAGIVIGVMIAVGLALFGAYYVTMKQKQSDLQESLIETGPSSYGQK
jgi:orotate phosphoribosyltransferase